MTKAVVEVVGATKVYAEEAVPVYALNGVDLTVREGEFVSLAGPSGSGKSTLLNVIGGLDRPTAGTVKIDGTALEDLDDAQLADLRLHKIGFVFQAYNLIPVLSAQENVEFIMQLQGVASEERAARAAQVLQTLGLSEMAHRRPGELSGGQQQRVAVARAVVSEPALLLADEPSANLDSTTTGELLDLLKQLNEERGVTIVAATHDEKVMGYAKRRITLRDGLIDSDSG